MDETHDAAHAAAAEHGGGLPQLDFSTWPSQIIWLAIALVVLYLILTRIALPKIAATLEERQDTIAGDLDMAAEYNQRAEEAEAAYHAALDKARVEARKIGDQAKSEIQAELGDALAEADKKIGEKTAESVKRIAEIQAEAKVQATTVAKDTAAALVERFSPTPVDGARIEKEVGERIAAGRLGG